MTAFCGKPDKVVQHLSGFDFDSVSGPAVKKIKNMELYTNAEMKSISVAAGQINDLMLKAQEYYVAKTVKAQAMMRQSL